MKLTDYYVKHRGKPQPTHDQLLYAVCQVIDNLSDQIRQRDHIVDTLRQEVLVLHEKVRKLMGE